MPTEPNDSPAKLAEIVAQMQQSTGNGIEYLRTLRGQLQELVENAGYRTSNFAHALNTTVRYLGLHIIHGQRLDLVDSDLRSAVINVANEIAGREKASDVPSTHEARIATAFEGLNREIKRLSGELGLHLSLGDESEYDFESGKPKRLADWVRSTIEGRSESPAPVEVAPVPPRVSQASETPVPAPAALRQTVAAPVELTPVPTRMSQADETPVPTPAALRQTVAAPVEATPAQPTVNQDTETRVAAARGPAISGVLVAGGIVGGFAAARKDIKQGDYLGAVRAAVPSVLIAGIPAMPDLARWRALNAEAAGHHVHAATLGWVAEKGGPLIGLLFAGEAWYASKIATERAATAQDNVKEAEKKLEELKAPRATGDRKTATEKLNAARTRAAEAEHDKALAGFNVVFALVGTGSSLPLWGKFGFRISAAAAAVGLLINAADTAAQYVNSKGNAAENVARWIDDRTNLGALLATNSETKRQPPAGQLAASARELPAKGTQAVPIVVV